MESLSVRVRVVLGLFSKINQYLLVSSATGQDMVL